MEAWKLFMLTMQVICTKYRFCLKNSGKNSKFSCDFEFFLYFFWMKLWVITRYSSRKNSWEKSYKSTKPSYSSGTILQVTAEKEKSYFSSRKIYSRNLKNNARSLAKCGCTSFKFPIFIVILLLLQKKNEY